MKAKDIADFAQLALKEDRARRDITTKSVVPFAHRSRGAIIVKENAVLCGLPLAKAVFKKLNRNVQFKSRFKDGAYVKRNTKIATITGQTRALLAGERAALNFLGYLSGISTNTHKYVQKARWQKTKIYDTRKTAPGLRTLDKYAVLCGGGCNHRFDLGEMVLIKDNHRNACHPELTIAEAIKQVRRKTRKPIQIEVDTLGQFKQALGANPDLILLDNMNCSQLKRAVKIASASPIKTRPLLEASGGITLNNIAQIARTGVDRISIGSLTHTHRAIDVSMELDR